ncbi:MAG TPA: PQQ-dependent sugar dehydrogenase [Phycisphaerae bacterium]|nr:PQQ-dependent sugar dehydrogenase [Phycisphaerae bacterium]
MAHRRIVYGITLLTISGCTSRPPQDAIGLRSIATGLTSPVALVESPDGSHRLFVVDQIGVIRIINPDDTPASTPFLDIRDKLIPLSPAYDERGLLCMAFHPKFASNNRFFVVYNAPSTSGGADCDLVLSEFAAVTDLLTALPTTEKIILRIAKPQSNHNGGQIAFGPDGFLYFSIGDGGGGGDVGSGHTPDLGNAQDKTTLLGKILRLDVDSASPYAIPPDNPFVGIPSARGEIWAYGLRNPWRFSFDMVGGRLFAGDVGQDAFEEVDIIEKGGNYGWHIREGFSCYNSGSCSSTGADGEPLIDPIVAYPHQSADGSPHGEAIIGGFVYRGSTISSLAGQYIFGDFTAGGLVADGQLFAGIENADGTWTPRTLPIAGRPGGALNRYVFGFGQDSSGEVYVLTSSNPGPSGTTGEVFKLVPP